MEKILKSDFGIFICGECGMFLKIEDLPCCFCGNRRVLGGIEGAVIGHQLIGRWQEGKAMGGELGLVMRAAIGDVKDCVLRRTRHKPQHRQPPVQGKLVPRRWAGNRWAPKHWE